MSKDDDKTRRRVLRGKVRWFNAEKGYAFISPEGGGQDIIVHYSAITAGHRELAEGEFIEFEVEDRPNADVAQAVSVRSGGVATASTDPRATGAAPSAVSVAKAALNDAYDALRRRQGHIFQAVLADAGGSALTLPVSIYLSSATNAGEVELAVVELLDAVGLDVVDARPPVVGSWIRLMVARARNWLRSDQSDEIVARVERAIQVRLLDQPQAEVDAKQAEAVARLVQALEPHANAAVQVGSLFLLKIDGTLVVRNLSPKEMSYLSGSPSVLATPRDVLTALETYAQQESALAYERRAALPEG